jgi:hypothetical protein
MILLPLMGGLFPDRPPGLATGEDNAPDQRRVAEPSVWVRVVLITKADSRVTGAERGRLLLGDTCVARMR